MSTPEQPEHVRSSTRVSGTGWAEGPGRSERSRPDASARADRTDRDDWNDWNNPDGTVTMPRVAAGASGVQYGSQAAPRHGRAGAAAGAGRGASLSTASPGTPAGTPVQRTRRARLSVLRVDPWSVMKLSFLLSIALGIVVTVAVAVLWNVIDGLGVFDAVGRFADQVTSGEDGGGIDIDQYVGLDRVLSLTALLSAINVVLLTALATLAAFLYNVCAALVGGLQVTLAEDD